MADHLKNTNRQKTKTGNIFSNKNNNDIRKILTFYMA